MLKIFDTLSQTKISVPSELFPSGTGYRFGHKYCSMPEYGYWAESKEKAEKLLEFLKSHHLTARDK